MRISIGCVARHRRVVVEVNVLAQVVVNIGACKVYVDAVKSVVP